MPRREVTFSLDVEASGPIPGPFWMCSFGICRTDDVEVGFSRELKPITVPALSRSDLPAAMEVVARGLPDVEWDYDEPVDARVATVRRHFEQRGVEPVDALVDLKGWLREQTGSDGLAVIVGAPATFDFMWLYWYWQYFLEEMPSFGYSGLDVRSYFMGFHGVGYLGTGKRRYLKHYPNPIPHSHDPLDDARQQGQIWQDMTRDRRRASLERRG